MQIVIITILDKDTERKVIEKTEVNSNNSEILTEILAEN